MRTAIEPNEAILGELVTMAKDRERGLHQFLSLAGARQYARLYDAFRRHVPTGGDVLDWGAGNGHFSYFLTRAGYRATGFSFEGFGFESWLDVPSYRFVPGHAEEPIRLPFPSESFDAVASVGVLEHVRETGGNELASLVEIRRVLRPGGVLVAYHFPNQTSWIDLVASRVPGKHHHVYRYRRREIDALASQADLELVEVERYGLFPRNSCHVLLGPLRGSRRAADLWDALDGGLGRLLSPLCQNWMFMARRPRRGDA